MSKTSKETAAVMRPEESQRDENQQTSAPAREAPLVEIAAFANPHDSHETTGVAPTPEADFEIDPEFQSLLPPLTPEEHAGLSAQIEETKQVDDLVVLVVDGKRLLGDGHHRRKICQAKGIAYKTRDLVMKNRAEAMEWIVTNQLGKRNLTDEQRAYYRGKSYLNAKQEAGGDRKSGSTARIRR